MVTGGGTLAVAAFADRDPAVVTDVGRATPSAGAAGSDRPRAASGLGRQKPKNEADRRPQPRPSATSSAASPAVRPAGDDRVVTTRTVSETRVIPYQTRRVPDRELADGDQRVEDPGNDGEEILRYRVTYVNGRLTDRRLVNSKVTREPTNRVVAFGTRPIPTPAPIPPSTPPPIPPTTGTMTARGTTRTARREPASAGRSGVPKAARLRWATRELSARTMRSHRRPDPERGSGPCGRMPGWH